MAINISTDVAVTTGGKLTDIGSIQGGWKSVSTYSDMAALTGSATSKGKLQNGQVFYVIADKELYSLSITGNAPFQTYSFSQFEFPMTSSVGGSTDISALNNFTGSIQSEVDSLTAATSSYILVSDTASMSVFSALTASYIDPLYISASAAASGFGDGLHTNISALNNFTGSIQSEVDSLTAATSSYLTAADTASFLTELPSGVVSGSDQITDVITDSYISASVAASGFGDGLHTDITSLNSFTGSIQSEVDSLTAATSSYALITDISGAFTSDSSSFSTRITSLENFAGGGDITSVIAGAGLSGGSESGDATITLDTSSTHFTTGVSASAAASGFGSSDWNTLSNIPSGIISSSDQITITESQISDLVHTDISDLNTFSGSIQSQVDSLIAATSSYLTSETDSQTLSIVGDQLSISNGNTITIPTTDTSSFITNDQTASMSVATASYAEYAVSASYEISYEVSSSYADSALTASYIDPLFISSSAAASGFGAGGGIFAPTGSVYSTTNDLEITGSLTVADGVLRLSELTITPTAEAGAIFYSASNFYFGINE